MPDHLNRRWVPFVRLAIAWPALALGLCSMANAQDCDYLWDADFANTDLAVYDMLIDDVGDGSLYIGGGFRLIDGVSVTKVGRWDGEEWHRVGSELDGTVFGIEFFDDGTGRTLYACGNLFDSNSGTLFHVARLSDGIWEFLDVGGSGMVANKLEVFDDGTGEALYVTGDFDSIDGVGTHNGIAKWDGSSWSALGNGLGGQFPFGIALEVFSSGTESHLYVGGLFTSPGSRIARWNGTAWDPMRGVDSKVSDLRSLEFQGEALLVAGGTFRNAGTGDAWRVAAWDGATWRPLGNGVTGNGNATSVNTISLYDDGSGLEIYVGGLFTFAEGTNVASWDGQRWRAIATGTDGPVWAMAASASEPVGPALHLGGAFATANDEPAINLARYLRCFECPADLDGDGDADALDFFFYLDAFANGNTDICDIDGDADCDAEDFFGYLDLFATGC